MKNRLNDKKAGILILVALIIISVAEVIYRAVVANGIAFSTANFGEQLTVIIFALMILIFSATGKDRVCYILYGAWIAYFVMDQAFELPGMIGDLFINNSHPSITFSIILRMVSMLCIITLSALLVEYMNDGTIYNRAFNLFCIITILATLGTIFVNVYNIVNGMPLEIMLAVFNNLYCIIMLFLFTFFAYDSAKKQLNKVDFSK